MSWCNKSKRLAPISEVMTLTPVTTDHPPVFLQENAVVRRELPDNGLE